MIESLFQAVILFLAVVDKHGIGLGMAVEQAGKVQAPGFPLGYGGLGIQNFHPANHFLHRAETQLRHNFPQLLGYEKEVVDDILRLAGKAFPQFRVLGGNAHGAGVQVALPQHNAAADNQRSRGKADFIGPQQESDGGVPAGFQLPIGLHYDPAAEVVGDQYLLGFGQAQLPGQAGVFDRGLRRGSGAAVMPANQHYIAVAFGNAGGDGANAHFRHQFDMDPGRRIDVFQVVNQLGQILNGIDVVMRRRGNQFHAGGSMPHPADNFIHLVTRQLPALPGLGTLGHFDLQVRGVDQIVGRNPEPARGHLLDGAVAGIAIGIRSVAVIILAALAGVAARPDAVHGNRHGFVGFLADGAERGGAGGKTLDNFLRRLHFRQGNRRAVVLELQQAAQGRQLAALVVDRLAELLIRLPAVGPGGVLELGDSVGIPLVDFAVPPPLVHPARFQIQLAGQRLRRKGKAMPLQLLRRHGVQANAGHPGGRPGKVLVN